MTRDDIIAMAREAGFVTLAINEDKWVPYLERFAALVADAEREACAQIARNELSNCNLLLSYPQQSSAAWNIMNAIRARGQA